MVTRNLNCLHIAALLVSASYGIGFLFGSGELALRLGMAGSIYAIATATGMVFLALFSRQLWSSGMPIWDVFGRAYGAKVKGCVALLSIIWMAGVLAAQIHGSVAILTLAGLPMAVSYALALALLLAACSLNLRLASKLFSVCLVGSNLLLLYALSKVDGLSVYLDAVPNFLQDVHLARPYELFVTMVAIIFLVFSGADYQQFVIAARRPIDAVVGCLLAAIFLFLTGFLPAAAVLAARQAGMLHGLADPKQVIPFLLMQFTRPAGVGISIGLLLILLSAALGSGAAIIRAMTAALASTIPTGRQVPRPLLTLIVTLAGAVVAARGQAIIDTMVAVNIVYIASIAILFIALQRGVVMAPQAAQFVMGVGFVTSLGFYVVGWIGFFAGRVESLSLLCGLISSVAALVVIWFSRIERVA
jgi:SSS family solute:Na+ symporter